MVVRVETELEKYLGTAILSAYNDDGSRLIYRGKPYERTYSLSMKAADKHQLKEIQILKHGLSKIKRQPDIKIIIKPSTPYIRIGIESLNKWQQSEWLTGKGKPVKYREEWQEIHKMLKEYKIVETDKGQISGKEQEDGI